MARLWSPVSGAVHYVQNNGAQLLDPVDDCMRPRHAAGEPAKMVLTPVESASDGPQWPMTFATAMGVRKDNAALLENFDLALQHRKCAIDALLTQYYVPLVDTDGEGTRASIALPHQR